MAIYNEWPNFSTLAESKIVKINTNEMYDLPDEFNKLRNVVELRLLRNIFKPGRGFSELPPTISQVITLKLLDMHANPLESIPRTICSLPNLSELNLESCKINTIPDEFMNLCTLKKLILDYNNITILLNIPHNVSYLSLVGNAVSDLSALCNLKKLTLLDVSENNIRSLPEDLFENKQDLQKLIVRENYVEFLPKSIGKLQSLCVINFSKNKLKDLPEEIANLRCLKYLNLSYNQLTSLSKSLIALDNLINGNFFCGSNPLQKPPIEVAREGLSMIRVYFAALEREPEIHNKRTKIVILGESESGKTSFVHAVVNGREQRDCEKASTISIDFFHWKAQPLSKNGLEILFVDCAGQKKYMVTHQLFVSQGTLFAIIVDLEKYKPDPSCFKKQIGYWLDLVIARVPDSKILIIPTHIDLIKDPDLITGRCRDIIERVHNYIDEKNQDQKDDFKSLARPYLPTSYLVNTEIHHIVPKKHTITLVPISNKGAFPGLTKLKEEIIRVATHEHLCPNTNHVVPESWIKLEELCIKERDLLKPPVISVDELMNKIDQLMNKKGYFQSKEDAIQALRYIDSVGPVLYFYGVENCEVVFLEPIWLLKLLKLVFRDDHQSNLLYCERFYEKYFEKDFDQEKNYLLEKAKLSKKLLRCLWNDEIKDKLLFKQVKEILKKFDFVYDMKKKKDKKHFLLVPFFFKDQQPTQVRKKMPDEKKIVTMLETKGVCPDGFLKRFIVKVYSKNFFSNYYPWSEGFYGINQDGRILCKHKTTQYSSFIKVTGFAKAPDICHLWKYLIPILQILENFVKEWRGISYRLRSLCPNQHKPSATWPLDISKLRLNLEETICCPVDGNLIETWLILPPRGLLLVFIPSEQLDECCTKNMNEFLSKDEMNLLAECLSDRPEELRRALNVSLSELDVYAETISNSSERSRRIIEIWQRRKDPTRKHFVDAMHNMRPYPGKAVDIVISRNCVVCY